MLVEREQYATKTAATDLGCRRASALEGISPLVLGRDLPALRVIPFRSFRGEGHLTVGIDHQGAAEALQQKVVATEGVQGFLNVAVVNFDGFDDHLLEHGSLGLVEDAGSFQPIHDVLGLVLEPSSGRLADLFGRGQPELDGGHTGQKVLVHLVNPRGDVSSDHDGTTSTRVTVPTTIHSRDKKRESCIGPPTLDLSKRAEECPPLVVNSSRSPTTSTAIHPTLICQQRIATRYAPKRTHVSHGAESRRAQAASSNLSRRTPMVVKASSDVGCGLVAS